MPPIATTGIETASQISRSPSRPIGESASGFEGVAQTGPAPMYAAPSSLSGERLGDARGRDAEHEALLEGSLGAGIVAAEMDTVRAERQRGLDVVVDHERGRQVEERSSRLDHVSGRSPLEPELDHGRPALDGANGGLEVGHDRVQPHPSAFARESSVAGSRL